MIFFKKIWTNFEFSEISNISSKSYQYLKCTTFFDFFYFKKEEKEIWMKKKKPIKKQSEKVAFENSKHNVLDLSWLIVLMIHVFLIIRRSSSTRLASEERSPVRGEGFDPSHRRIRFSVYFSLFLLIVGGPSRGLSLCDVCQ